MAKEVVVTQQGLKALEDELEHLKIVRRKEDQGGPRLWRPVRERRV